jgi:tripartite-type tricarboxylate transporter receptor subunit TctC
MLTTGQILKLLAAPCLALVLSNMAEAAEGRYPSKVVRLMVPFSPGSGSDTIGRIIGNGLTEQFGQQVIVDNRGGAAGNIGAELVSRAAPDGYTLLLVNMGHAANVTLYSNLPYDLLRDFAPVTLFATAPAMLVVHPSLPAKSTAELVKLAKSKPGAINYASGGVGTPTFVAAELFKTRAGINLMHIPYKSGGEAITAVLSGESQVYFSPFAVALPHVRQNRLRGLAVTTLKRVPVLPEYPTIAELGYPGYQTGNWYGITAPAKTPREIITALHGAAVAALKNPTASKRLQDLGYIAVGDTPEEFGQFMKAEVESLARLLKDHRVTGG